MKRLPSFILTIAFLVAGCSVLPGRAPRTPTAAPTATPRPHAVETARAFLQAWAQGDYATMYSLVAPSRQASITSDQFISRYKGINTEATITKVTPTLLSASEDGDDAVVNFNVSFETAIVGSLQQDNVMQLHRENDRWGVLWSPGLIFSQLAGGGSIKLYPITSPRGNILDRKGRPLTSQQETVVVEVVPSEMKNEGAVLAALGQVFNKTPAAIKALYSKFPSDWRTAVGTLTADQLKPNLDTLNQPGIHTDTTKDVRTYPLGEAASHVVGYVGQVSADDLVQMASMGYRDGDWIGKTGLEQWGEPYLAGQRGGKLVVLSPNGTISATLASVPAKQSQNIYTTLDNDALQIAEKALGDKKGAVVMMDIRTGGILAMVSHPAFDPNRISNRMSASDWQAILKDPGNPLFNRASQGAFPPGSVFKIVSYSAAIEKGVFAPTSIFNDPGYWDGLGKGYRKYCWIYEQTGKGHGTISLQSALTASCDVTFYQVGAKLDQVDRGLMTNFAHAFGLGSDTGIEIPEVAGSVPDPQAGNWTVSDAVNTVIGQGTMLVTPLQVVDMLAAVANGGTLWKAHLVDRITSIADGTEKITQPEERGKLPISVGTLTSLRKGLLGVTQDKLGTAAFVFRGDKITVAGKTGTAEVLKQGDPHAWFAGYAPADNPRIAMVVFVEHGGEGSKVAAPIFREIMDKYLALPGNH